MDDRDLGSPTSYLALPKGIPVFTASGREIGRVKKVLSVPVKNVFDGIVIRTPEGDRFVDAPESGRLFEGGVATILTDEEAAALEAPGSDLQEKARRVGRRTLRRFRPRG